MQQLNTKEDKFIWLVNKTVDELPPLWNFKVPQWDTGWLTSWLNILQLQMGNIFTLSQATEKKRTILGFQNISPYCKKSLWDYGRQGLYTIWKGLWPLQSMFLGHWLTPCSCVFVRHPTSNSKKPVVHFYFCCCLHYHWLLPPSPTVPSMLRNPLTSPLQT